MPVGRGGRAKMDKPLTDTTPYGMGSDDSVTDASESAALTHHETTINRTNFSYTAWAGHLVTTDPYSARPAAKIFYVAFTRDGVEPPKRPVTFFYNGGPGSSSVFLLLGSFGPRRIETRMPDFTPPAPYEMVDNPDSLLDVSDMVFINPVGTGYSAAIAPGTNKDFWGVDDDTRSIRQFVKRYLTVYDRWNSPKFLFGESYGTPRTCVLTWLLHEDGVDLNGVVLQSSVLDYSKDNSPVGLLPTMAADAWFHGKVTVSPRPRDLRAFLEEVVKFARSDYAAAIASVPNVNHRVVQTLSEYTGIPEDILLYWKLDVSFQVQAGKNPVSAFLTALLQSDGFALGSYDGRVKADDTGIAGSVDPGSGGNDPTMTAVGGVYTAMWNVYLNDELQFTSTSPFMDSNDQAFANWNWTHVDPTGGKTTDQAHLYTAGDLAAAMALNPYLRVFSANGCYDAVTPFFQTQLDLENMPLKNPRARDNLTVHNYESGHMVYLDDTSRSAMKGHLEKFYSDAVARPLAAAALKTAAAQYIRTEYRRRISRVPY